MQDLILTCLTNAKHVAYIAQQRMTGHICGFSVIPVTDGFICKYSVIIKRFFSITIIKIV